MKVGIGVGLGTRHGTSAPAGGSYPAWAGTTWLTWGSVVLTWGP